jgi:fatty-acyl-CoA synthase
MSHPPALGSWPARRARARPDAVALVHDGRRTTYAELHRRVAALAGGFARRGVEPGDRVAYLGPNLPAFVETLFAVTALGAVFVPLSTRIAPERVDALLADAGARLLVHPPSETADALGTAIERVVVGTDDEAMIATSEPREALAVDPDHPAVLMYTSGTTGRAKGARLSHGNVVWNALSVLVDVDLAADEVCLVSAPLFHAAALGMTAIPVLLKGGTLVLEETFDVERTYDLIERERVTMMFGVPTMFDVLARDARFDVADLSSLRYLLCGGAPLPHPLIGRYAARGLTFMQGYGMTEASPGVLLLSADDTATRIGSAGKPAFFVDVELRDPDGGPVPDGARGELLVRGPNLVDGYWGRADDPAFTADGWFRSGDVAVRDADGFHYVVDRLTDMYISGGENVYPAEVESVLVAHPAVVEAAVVGVPDERWGEAGRAYVVAADGARPDADDVRAFVAERLGRFRAPRDVEMVATLPRTPTGKLDKKALRACE